MMLDLLLQDLGAGHKSGTALFERTLRRAAQGDEIRGAVIYPASHALATRQVHGDVLHGVHGYSGVISGITAADNLGAAATAGGPIPGQYMLPDGSGPSSGFQGGHFWLSRLLTTGWTCFVSATRLQVQFYLNGAPVAASAVEGTITVVPFRLEGNGNITRGVPITIGGAGAATEARDTEVAGRHTFYYVSAVDLDGANSASLFVAGEGGSITRSRIS